MDFYVDFIILNDSVNYLKKEEELSYVFDGTIPHNGGFYSSGFPIKN